MDGHIDRTNWKRVRLGDLVARQTISMGRGNVISKEAIESDPGAYPVFSSSATGDGIIGYYARYMFEDERISWSIDGGGKFFYHPASRYSVTNVSGWIKVHKPAEINTRYLYLALDAEWQKKHFDYQTKAHPSVIKNEYIIAYPDFDTQNKIAAVITSCDDYITAIQSLITKYEAIKKSTVKLLLTPKEGWQEKSLGDLAFIKTGGRNTQDATASGRYPFFVRSPNVERIDTYSFDGEAILVAGDGVGAGKVFHYINGKHDCHQRVYRIRDFHPEVMGRFIYCVLSEQFPSYMERRNDKASVDSLRLPAFKSFPVSYPDVNEQKRIVTILDSIDDTISELRAQLVKSQSIKQGMMTYFFG